MMTWRTAGLPLLVGTMVVALVLPAAAQSPTQKPPISTPSVVAPPTWWRAIPMPDGRTFVTDGGLSIDAALVKPSNQPQMMPPEAANAIVRLLASPVENQVAMSDLRPGTRPNTFITPDGVIINGNYITLFRSVLPSSARLGVRGKTAPIVLLVDGRPVGVMMPVQPPREQ